MWFVYIIKSESSGRWYIGMTNDLVGRIMSHNAGLNRSTAGRGPWTYIFVRPIDSKGEAAKFERYLKANRNKERIMKKFAEYFRHGVYPGKVGAS